MRGGCNIIKQLALSVKATLSGWEMSCDWFILSAHDTLTNHLYLLHLLNHVITNAFLILTILPFYTIYLKSSTQLHPT